MKYSPSGGCVSGARRCFIRSKLKREFSPRGSVNSMGEDERVPPRERVIYTQLEFIENPTYLRLCLPLPRYESRELWCP